MDYASYLTLSRVDDPDAPLPLSPEEEALGRGDGVVAHWRVDGGWSENPAPGEAADLRDFAWLATAMSASSKAPEGEDDAAEPDFLLKSMIAARARHRSTVALASRSPFEPFFPWAKALLCAVFCLLPLWRSGGGRRSFIDWWIALAMESHRAPAPALSFVARGFALLSHLNDPLSAIFNASPAICQTTLLGGVGLLLGVGTLFVCSSLLGEGAVFLWRWASAGCGALRRRERARRLLRGILAHGGAWPEDWRETLRERGRFFVGDTPFFLSDRHFGDFLPKPLHVAYRSAVWGRGDECLLRVAGGGRYRKEGFRLQRLADRRNVWTRRREALSRRSGAWRSRAFWLTRAGFFRAFFWLLSPVLAPRRREARAALRLMRERARGRGLTREQTLAVGDWALRNELLRQRSGARLARWERIGGALRAFAEPPVSPPPATRLARAAAAGRNSWQKIWLPMLVAIGTAEPLVFLALPLPLWMPKGTPSVILCVLCALWCSFCVALGVRLLVEMSFHSPRGALRWVAFVARAALARGTGPWRARLARHEANAVRRSLFEAASIAAAMEAFFAAPTVVAANRAKTSEACDASRPVGSKSSSDEQSTRPVSRSAARRL
jgi:hypothetical protein